MPNTKADLFNQAALAINNSLADSGVRDQVAAYGYSVDKLNEGRALLDAAQAASNDQLAAAGEQQQATAAFQQANIAARDAYQALAKVARATCDKASQTMLGLSGRVPQSTSGFLTAAFTLFDNAPRVPALANFGYDEAKLTAGRGLIRALQTADQAQEVAKGTAQQATGAQQAAVKALDAWLAQYLKIAKVALRTDAQQLEKLGVAARTSKTAAQKAAASGKPPIPQA